NAKCKGKPTGKAKSACAAIPKHQTRNAAKTHTTSEVSSTCGIFIDIVKPAEFCQLRIPN
ncbi:MAG TPA: hypothetical protein VGO47_12620, partial [Chlamydiales bacterium]|nr:hypothetical protein [Chlamydiales bacterium]